MRPDCSAAADGKGDGVLKWQPMASIDFFNQADLSKQMDFADDMDLL